MNGEKPSFMLSVTVLCASLTLCSALSHRRLMGGAFARIEDFPWQISLIKNYEHICGGSIISQQHVLTAAHCVDNQDARIFTVKYGTSRIFDGSGTVVNVDQIYTHPYFGNWDNDVAVLRLAFNIVFSKKALPVTLRLTEAQGQETAYLSGWGVDESTKYPSVLKWISVRIIDWNFCYLHQGNFSPFLTTNVICATAPGKGHCVGDSGGALVINRNQVGIVSYRKRGDRCADPDYPDRYTSVAKFKAFIDKASGYTAKWTT